MEGSRQNHQSAQFAVLNNRDLLDAIFENFGGLKTELGPLRLDPFPAALACKSFLDPALNAVWRSLDSLIPLLKLLPSFSDTEHHGVYALHGFVSRTEWVHFDSYAQRVKYFLAAESDRLVISQEVYSRLLQLRTTPLLSTLRHFYCTSVSSLGCGIFLFLSPSLKLVRLSGITTQQDNLVEMFTSALPSDVPMLRSLEVHEDLPRPSLSFALKLMYLRSLSLNNTTASGELFFMRHILDHQHLETLGVNLSRFGLDNTYSLARGLHKLKSLTVTGGSFQVVARFIALVMSYQIQTLVITMSQTPIRRNLNNHLLSLFQTLSQQRSTLRYLQVTYIHQGLYDNMLHDINIISSLTSCENLAHLDISNYPLLRSLTDEDVRVLTSHWPLMESLDLPSIHSGNKPSVSSLYHLAQSCPRLKHLRIPLDTSRSPPLSCSWRPEHGLQTLDTDGSDVFNPMLITRHLDYLFPKLVSVRGLGRDFASKWENVEDMLKLCQAVRLVESTKTIGHS